MKKLKISKSRLSGRRWKIFRKTEFFSLLKQENITENEYEKSKYIFEILKMRNFSDFNDLYNFQGVAILCEIVESRLVYVQKLWL